MSEIRKARGGQWVVNRSAKTLLPLSRHVWSPDAKDDTRHQDPLLERIGFDILCIPFRYLFSFLSNMVYLSLGSISCSVGISAFHRSSDSRVCPFFASAL